MKKIHTGEELWNRLKLAYIELRKRIIKKYIQYNRNAVEQIKDFHI